MTCPCRRVPPYIHCCHGEFLTEIYPDSVSSLKKTYYKFIDDVVINKHNTIHTNGNINVTKFKKLVNFNANNYFTKKIEHTNNITNNITRHNHNNYEHNVIKNIVYI